MAQATVQPSTTFYVGFDLGTTMSGYSSCDKGGDIHFAARYDKQPGLPYCKTKTALLYRKKDWTAISWGWKAYYEYKNMKPDDQAKFLYLDR